MKTSRSSLIARLLFVMLSVGIVFLAQGAGPKGTIYQVIVPKQGNLVANPSYFCWLPESVTTYRCIIVHQHGCTRERDARQMMYDVHWTTLAKKWHAVFMACSLTTGSDCGNWNNINNGSGNTYLAALDSLSQRSGHPEIKTIPWALWGHSGGSMWIMSMTGKYPDRVAVAVAQACGADISNVPAALKVPMLHHNGLKDMCYNDGLFGSGRAKGALWAHAINPYPMWVNIPPNPGWSTEVFGHAPRDLRMIAIPWIDIGLTSRLPDAAGASQLKDMDTSNAWLGDTGTRTIASAATFTGDKLKACWFPNEYFAKKWTEYMLKGTLNDSTPPPAPYNLNGTYSNRQIVLKWDADADLETGIKTFIIYRNGTVLTTLQYNTTTLFTSEKGYQRWNDGDEPAPNPAPAMTYTDNNLSDTGTYTYQVSTVNWSGVLGPTSAAIALKRGQVTNIATLPGRSPSIKQTQVSLMNIGSRALFMGPVSLYDIRGRRLASAVIPEGQRIDIKGILKNKTDNLVVVRFQTK